MRKAHILIAFVVITLLATACGGKDEANAPVRSMTVFCGSASKPVMEELAPAFEKERGVAVKVVYGGSGTLLSQIELSRQGEIYLPGSPDYIAIAEQKGLIIPGSAVRVAYLVPAIITPAGNPARIRGLDDLTRPGVKVGIGNPETVCLGLYAIELLQKNGLLEKVLGNVVTFGGSCSKTANLASMNQVDAILGWRVFHHWNPERMDFVPIAPDRIPRLSYIPVSIPVHTRDEALSREFIDFMLGKRGRAVYAKYGYLADEAAARVLAPAAGVGGEYSLPANYRELIRHVGKNR